MKFLTSHGEKLVCAVVVILCAVWMVQALQNNTAKKQQEIRDCEKIINIRLQNNTATEAFPLHPSRVPDYVAESKERMRGAETSVGAPLVVRSFYPQPDRPVVQAKEVESVTSEEAVPVQLKHFVADGQQGMVVVTCPQPEKTPHFVPVRIEIQRGTAPEKLTENVHVFELEQETAAKPDDATKKSEQSDAAPGDEKSGSTARSERRRPSKPRSARDKKKETVKVKPPCRFEDVGVAAQTTYYYRARLVSQLVPMGPDNIIIRDTQRFKIVVPDSLEKVASSTAGVTLYAMDWTPVQKATVPASFELRFNFVTGTLPLDPRAPQVGYGAFFGVRLWDKEARAWGESSYNLPVGQPLSGKLKFKTETATRLREFETGFIFDSVRPAIKFEVERVKEHVMVDKTDENGESISTPDLDESGQPKLVEKLITRRTSTQVAVLRVGDTDQQIRLIKGMGYGEKLDPDVRILLDGEPEPDLQKMMEKASKPDDKAKPGTAPATTPEEKPKAAEEKPTTKAN
jgi:hypothetical protein